MSLGESRNGPWQDPVTGIEGSGLNNELLMRTNGMIDIVVELGILDPTEAEELTREFLLKH